MPQQTVIKSKFVCWGEMSLFALYKFNYRAIKGHSIFVWRDERVGARHEDHGAVPGTRASTKQPNKNKEKRWLAPSYRAARGPCHRPPIRGRHSCLVIAKHSLSILLCTFSTWSKPLLIYQTNLRRYSLEISAYWTRELQCTNILWEI